jgi:uncharacterized protein
MTWTAEEQALVRRHLRARAAARAAEWAERREGAWRLATVAAGRLREDFGAADVLVFGSLARSGPFDEQSDIDVAVSGLDESAYLDAVRMLLGLDSAFLIDLVRLECASATLREEITLQGVRV